MTGSATNRVQDIIKLLDKMSRSDIRLRLTRDTKKGNIFWGNMRNRKI